jgi:hypothetical protein
MKIPRLRQRHEHRGEGEPASEAADDPAPGAGSSSSETVGGVRVPPAAPASSEGITAVAFAVECYADAWREAATDAELAFGWWVTASVRDRSGAATAYFAAFEREEKAALAYQDARVAWRLGRARDEPQPRRRSDEVSALAPGMSYTASYVDGAQEETPNPAGSS